MSNVTQLCGRLRPDLGWDIEPADDGQRHQRIPMLAQEVPVVSLRLRRDVLDFDPGWLARTYGAQVLEGLGYEVKDGALVKPAKLSDKAFVEVFLGHTTEKGYLGKRYVPTLRQIKLGKTKSEMFPVEQACGLLSRYHGLLEEAE